MKQPVVLYTFKADQWEPSTNAVKLILHQDKVINVNIIAPNSCLGFCKQATENEASALPQINAIP
jgi:hypothetical protein